MSSFIKLLKNKLVGAWPSNYSKPRRTVASELVVGLGGFEPPTSPLSGVRSNQLSYRPILASFDSVFPLNNQQSYRVEKGVRPKNSDAALQADIFGLTPAV